MPNVLFSDPARDVSPLLGGLLRSKSFGVAWGGSPERFRAMAETGLFDIFIVSCGAGETGQGMAADEAIERERQLRGEIGWVQNLLPGAPVLAVAGSDDREWARALPCFALVERPVKTLRFRDVILRAAAHLPGLGDIRKEPVAAGSIHTFYERYERAYSGTLSLANVTGRGAPSLPVRTVRLSTRGLTLRTSRRDGMSDEDLTVIEAAQSGQPVTLSLAFGKKEKKSDHVPAVDLRGDVTFVDRIDSGGLRSVGLRFDPAQWGTALVELPVAEAPAAEEAPAPAAVDLLPAKFAQFWSLVRTVAA